MFLLILACTGNSIDLKDTEVADTAPPEDTSPQPDMSQYTSTLDVTFDTWGDSYDCTDVVDEDGDLIEDEDDLEALSAACPLCTHFYEAVPERTQLCESEYLTLPDSSIRGFVFGEGAAAVYTFDERDSGDYEAELMDNAATWDGWTLNYSGETSGWAGVEIEAELTFEAI